MADVHIVTISRQSTPDTADYADLPDPAAEMYSLSEVARTYRRLSQSIDSYLVSTMGSNISINTTHSIRSQGQEEKIILTSSHKPYSSSIVKHHPLCFTKLVLSPLL
jgi:hypothetical protein